MMLAAFQELVIPRDPEEIVWEKALVEAGEDPDLGSNQLAFFLQNQPQTPPSLLRKMSLTANGFSEVQRGMQFPVERD